MKQVTLLVTGIACLCIGVGVGWLLANPGEKSQRLALAESDLQSARSEIKKLKGDLDHKSTSLSLSRQAAREATVALAEQPTSTPNPAVAVSAVSGGKAAGSPEGGSVGKSLRKMMDNPGFRAAIQQQQGMQIEMGYSRLFDSFQLNPEEKEKFKQLLADRLTSQTELGMKLMDETLTPEQRKQISEGYQTTKGNSDTAIKQFLNDENDFQTFSHWEESASERTQFDMMGRALFSASGEPLQPQQEDQLINLMVEIRKQPGSIPSPLQPGSFDPSKLNAESIQQQLQLIDQNAQTVAQRAGGFLSESQVGTLKKWQEQMHNMTEKGLQMSATFFNPNSK